MNVEDRCKSLNHSIFDRVAGDWSGALRSRSVMKFADLCLFVEQARCWGRVEL